ncbi:MAG: SEL1-like repeat protein [Ruminococcus sp.]|nr:SEL1-like repeat protein [Ruminococcus sp.]
MPLSQIIVTSRYLKSGSARSVTKRKNYTKYIATRETVEKREQNQLAPNAATTEKQKEMLSELLSDFPEAKRYLEYEDYTANPIVQNASELITTIIERHADVIGNRQNFVGYMAKRPGAEQRGVHGLFNDSDEPIVLNQVADEVAHHKGNVWSHVVSLRREDAIRLGYDNSDRWRELVKRQIPVIAEQSRIPMSNLKWYAAFHDTTHHPHIHLIVYSTNPKQGYLSREGIDKIRSAFANDIFHDDLQSIYQEQTLSRDELKSISQEQVHQMVMQIQNSTFNNPQLEKMMKKLHEQLQTVSGKKVYGYLPQDVKRTVDDIFAELAKDKQVAQLYEKWCELERLKYKIYTQKEPELPALADNKVFKPVKNMIIRAVLDMRTESILSELEVPMETGDMLSPEDFKWNPDGAFETEVEPSEQTIEDEIDRLAVLADQGKMFAAYKLGRMYLKGDKVPQDKEKAEHYLKMASDAGNEYTQYLLANLYLTEKKNIPNAISLLESAAEKNSWASYLLGKLYLFGADGIERDVPQAIQWLTQSAEGGNEYAQQLLDNMEQRENAAFASTIFGLFVSLSRAIEDDYNKSHKKLQSKVDSKIQRMIRKHKQELGIRDEHGMTMQ